MLVLSRKKNESLMIGDDIVLTVVEIRGDKVRLGIHAPSNVPVHRQEVYDAIRRDLNEDQSTPPLSGQSAAEKPTDASAPEG